MKVFSQLVSAQIENVTADPTPTATTVGRVIYRTDIEEFKICDPTPIWRTLTLDSLDNTLSFTGLAATPGTLPVAGTFKVYFKTDGKPYYLDEAGDEFAFGTGSGSGGINYLVEANDLDNDYVASGANFLVAENETLSIDDVKDLKFSKAAVDASTQYVSYPFVTRSFDANTPLNLTFDYKSDSVYSDGDYEVEIYDVTNTVVISNSNPSIVATELGTTHRTSFTPVSGSVNYEFRLKVVTADAAASFIQIDNIFCGPYNTSSSSSFVSDWEEFTASGSWTGTYTGKMKRVGDSALIRMSVTAVTVSPGNLSFNMPSGLLIDEGKLPNIFGTVSQSIGQFSVEREGIGMHQGVASPGSASEIFALMGTADTTRVASVFVTTSDPIPANATNNYSIDILVPIVGWDNGTRSTEIVSNRKLSVRAVSNGGEALTPNTTLIPFSTIETNLGGGWNGTTFTVPETDSYHFSGAVQLTAGLNGQIRAFVNGVVRRTMAVDQNSVVNFNGYMDLNKGDVVDFRTDISRTLLPGNPHLHHLSIERVSNVYSTTTPSETVKASYTTNAGQIIPSGSLTKVIFEDKELDSHDAYDIVSGEYSAPISGYYLASAVVWFSSTTNGVCYVEFKVTRGGAVTTYSGSVNVSSQHRDSASFSFPIDLNAGDTISVEAYQTSGSPGGSRALLSSSIVNRFSIVKVGN